MDLRARPTGLLRLLVSGSLSVVVCTLDYTAAAGSSHERLRLDSRVPGQREKAQMDRKDQAGAGLDGRGK